MTRQPEISETIYIRVLPEGGYVVGFQPTPFQAGFALRDAAAFSDIDEALEHIKGSRTENERGFYAYL